MPNLLFISTSSGDQPGVVCGVAIQDNITGLPAIPFDGGRKGEVQMWWMLFFLKNSFISSLLKTEPFSLTTLIYTP